jgi:2'-5' RNA ligase
MKPWPKNMTTAPAKPRALRRYAVIAEPRLGEADRDWVEALRRREDPAGFARVGPHLTLVFVVALAHPAPLLRAMRREAAGTKPFRIALDRVLRLEDVEGGAVICLGASRGRASLVRLHDRLYAGPLDPHWRRDIPYEPHLTLGRRRTAAAGARLAQRIAVGTPDLRAAIDSLLLIELGMRGAMPRRRFRLLG